MMGDVFEWILTNKEWLFSGIGIAAIPLLYSFLHNHLKKKDKVTKTGDELSNLLKSPFGEKALQCLSETEQALDHISKINDSIFEDAALSKLNQCLNELLEISNGKIKIEHPVELTNTPVELSRRMTSLQSTTLWYNDPAEGVRRERLLEIQANSIKENDIVIQRLFIIDGTTYEEHKDDFLERISSDHRDGVKVRWMRNSDWISCEAAMEPIDFGIWDEELVWLYEQTL